jgi:hypothetical protein
VLRNYQFNDFCCSPDVITFVERDKWHEWEDVHLYLSGTTEETRLLEWPRLRRKDNIKIALKGTAGDGSRQWKVDTADSTCCLLYSTFRLHKGQGTYWLLLVQSLSSEELCCPSLVS